MVKRWGAYWPILFFVATAVYFLFPMLTMQKAFIDGDYLAQFYPWMWLYAKALKAGMWTFWSSQVQAGIDLFAEGQTAMFYLPNLILFKILPFKIAYNALFILHFLFPAICTYFYARSHGLSIRAATLVVLGFSFGSAYAGCFYGIYSLRPLAWFPLGLICLDGGIRNKQTWCWGVLAFGLGQAWLAGYAQMTVYMHVFYALYTFLHLFVLKTWTSRLRLICFLILSFALALTIGWPQFYAQFQAAMESTRVMQEKTFIFWGSVAPWFWVTLIMYGWGKIFMTKIYIGLIPALLIFVKPQFKKRAIFWIMAIFSLFMAMGVYNPFYWVLVHVPGASLLRNPSKFLYFACFFLSLLAGFSWDSIVTAMQLKSSHILKSMVMRVSALIATLYAFGIAGCAIAHYGEGKLLQLGEWYVRNFIMNKTYHRYSLEEYVGRLDSVMNLVRNALDLSSPIFWMPLFLTLAFLMALKLLSLGRTQASAFLVLVVLTLDVGIFTQSFHGSGFIGNLKPFPSTAEAEQLPRSNRWLDLSTYGNGLMTANKNILTDHDSLGVYTPLANYEYFDLMKFTGVVDDGFGRVSTDWEQVERAQPLLRFLGLQHFVSPRKIDWPQWKLQNRGEDFYYYESLDAQPEFTWVMDQTILAGHEERRMYLLSPEFKPESEVVLNEKISLPHSLMNPLDQPLLLQRVRANAQGFSHITLNASQPGFLVRNVRFDKHWKARMDGKLIPLIRANHCFQAIQTSEGEHDYTFSYEPWYWPWGVAIQALGYLGAILCIVHGYALWLVLVFVMYLLNVILPKLGTRLPWNG